MESTIVTSVIIVIVVVSISLRQERGGEGSGEEMRGEEGRGEVLVQGDGESSQMP